MAVEKTKVGRPRTEEPKRAIAVRLPLDDWVELVELAKEDRRPVAEYVRNILLDFLLEEKERRSIPDDIPARPE